MPDELAGAAPRELPEPDAALRTIDSRDIFQGDREVFVDHEGMIYRLRVTKAGKLILNK